MSTPVIEMRVRMRWWFYAYLAGVELSCYLLQCSPNVARVEFWAKRGIVIEIKISGCWYPVP